MRGFGYLAIMVVLFGFLFWGMRQPKEYAQAAVTKITSTALEVKYKGGDFTGSFTSRMGRGEGDGMSSVYADRLIGLTYVEAVRLLKQEGEGFMEKPSMPYGWNITISCSSNQLIQSTVELRRIDVLAVTGDVVRLIQTWDVPKSCEDNPKRHANYMGFNCLDVPNEYDYPDLPDPDTVSLLILSIQAVELSSSGQDTATKALQEYIVVKERW